MNESIDHHQFFPKKDIAMFTQIILTLLLVCTLNLTLLVHSSIIPSPPPFNISHFIFPKVSTFSEPTPIPPPHFLQGVLSAIADVQKWELEDIRVSKLDVAKVKYGSLQKYEFGVKVGETEIVLKLYDQVTEWTKLSSTTSNVSSDLETLVKGLRKGAVVDSFRIDGPFELRAVGNGGNLSLMLPLNVSHSGLSRISISKGISIEVKDAEEISIIHPPNHQEMPHGILKDLSWPLSPALPYIHILGPASVTAYQTRGPSSCIKTRRSSHNSIQLLPNRCFTTQDYQNSRHLFRSVPFLEKVVSSLFSDRGNQKKGFGSLKLRIKASNVFRFQLEVENTVRSNDAYWSTLPEWRTRPILERVWFEVSARIEGAIMKPLSLKKVRPFIDVDSNALSSLLSNLSFTKFPSGLVPPEALTLDVKW